MALALLFTLVGCTQPQPKVQAETPMTPTTPVASKNNTSSNRIMARLDGLSGEADPRLSALRSRFEQLGFTVMAMGVSASAPNPAAPNASRFSAFIVVGIEPAKTDMEKALAQFRASENFAYVEADQMLQQRK